MRRVFDNFDVIFFSERADFFHITDVARNVDRNNGLYAVRSVVFQNHFDCIRVDIVRIFFRIGKYYVGT